MDSTTSREQEHLKGSSEDTAAAALFLPKTVIGRLNVKESKNQQNADCVSAPRRL